MKQLFIKAIALNEVAFIEISRLITIIRRLNICDNLPYMFIEGYLI